MDCPTCNNGSPHTHPSVESSGDGPELNLPPSRAEWEALKAENAKTVEGAIRFIDSSLCAEHQGRVKMQSPGEFVAEHTGKCVLCAYRLNVELTEALQNMVGLFGEAVTRLKMGSGFTELHHEAVKGAKALLGKLEKPVGLGDFCPEHGGLWSYKCPACIARADQGKRKVSDQKSVSHCLVGAHCNIFGSGRCICLCASCTDAKAKDH